MPIHKPEISAIPRYIARLADRLFEDPTRRAHFVGALLSPPGYSSALAWLKLRPDSFTLPVEAALPWQPPFVDRVPREAHAGQHALHEQGFYYCLDLSSVFAASVFSAVNISKPLVIDLCAAPGGKSVLAYGLLSPQLIVANEVIGKRMAQLVSNLKRCSVRPAVLTNQDPAQLAAVAPQSADLLIVDAPCSGQSLLSKGRAVPGAFHPQTINMNAMRQRRIIANAAAMVAPGGFLAYMTCTFSKEENEDICSWLLAHFPQFVPVEVDALSQARSHLADNLPCYRMWPQDGAGAGSFTALFRNASEGEKMTILPIPEAWIIHELRSESGESAIFSAPDGSWRATL